MPVTSDFAPGKIILSGEYAVVFGHRALAVPARRGITVMHGADANPEVVFSDDTIHPLWKEYALEVLRLCEKFGGQPGKVTIRCDLPLGKGMGSSTALVTAIARAILGPDCETQARAIEDTMNPGHSGADFAVIWKNRPIVFSKESGACDAAIDLGFLDDALLIDTGQPDQTTPELVAWARERQIELTEPIRIISECSRRLIDGEDVKTVLKDHHRAQVALGVVPPETAALIESIERAGGFAKVIGAGSRTGGGGMVLCLGLEESALKTLTTQPVLRA